LAPSDAVRDAATLLRHAPALRPSYPVFQSGVERGRQLRDGVDRIQGRAVRRMGEILKQFNAQGRRTDRLNDGAVTKFSQKEAAESAGISERQRVTAVRVANVPVEKFEARERSPEFISE
jgi:hypothetical protein